MPVRRADVVERVRRFLLSDGVILDPDAGVADDDPLLRGRIDSVGLMELVAFIEDEFLIELGYDDIGEERLGTIGRIAELVEERHADA